MYRSTLGDGKESEDDRFGVSKERYIEKWNEASIILLYRLKLWSGGTRIKRRERRMGLEELIKMVEWDEVINVEQWLIVEEKGPKE